MNFFWNTPVESLPKTSGLTIKKLKSADINNYWELINYFPSRYEDYSLVCPINFVQVGETVTLTGQISDSQYRLSSRGYKIQQFVLKDNSGSIRFIFYNQPYLFNVFKKGYSVAISGLIEKTGQQLFMRPKEYEILQPDKQPIHTSRIVPVYPEKAGLSCKTIREKVWLVISQMKMSGDNMIAELFPQEIIQKNSLLAEYDAYMNIHFPLSLEIAKQAGSRLAFDELFLIQLSGHLVKKKWLENEVTNKFTASPEKGKKIKEFISRLPFVLTASQKTVLDEILNDMKKTTPMNRLLQGDVGSGKTIVALVACYFTYLNGFKSILMVPTEILAKQHFLSIQTILIKQNSTLKISLITGSVKPDSEDIKQADLIIGTHALIEKKILFNRVGLVIIDEQHRFGVIQRSLLKEKGDYPHLLTMTATPIPRTVALTLYGELDISTIEELPEGRKIIKTYVVPKQKRIAGYKWIAKQIHENNTQAFIVCPLIEESDSESLKTVKAVKKEFEFLQSDIFPELKIGLLHGKMKSAEKDKVMKAFQENKYQILLTTSVVEVGIDIPNATIMLIEGAERYGLAQLHQLRGRVGRSNRQSYCFLFTESLSEEILSRLTFFSKNNIGIHLAEYDLKHRGVGNIFGIEQHGYINLKIASLSDFQLAKKTGDAAEYFISNYKINDYDELFFRLQPLLSQKVTKD